MKKALILLLTLMCCGQVTAKCTYEGDSVLQSLPISTRLSLDPSIPVGSILFSRTVGISRAYKTFTCNKLLGDQYIIESNAPEVAGITGIQGKPVYETGYPGLGFQVSDPLFSKNGSVTPAVVGSTLVPVDQSSNDYRLVTVWIYKTANTIDTSSQAFEPQVKISAGNPQTNPRAADRLILDMRLKMKEITFRQSSCDISVVGPSQVTLETITRTNLLKYAQGDTTPAQKEITMRVKCPSSSYGGKINYWFNPIGGASAQGNGVIDNMYTGPDAAAYVGMIFKTGNDSVVFYNPEKYALDNLKDTQDIKFTADYYRHRVRNDLVTNGKVKAVMEVIIQED